MAALDPSPWEDPATWDSYARDFDNEVDHGLHDADAKRAWTSLLARWLHGSSGAAVDLGCGTGSLSLVLHAMGFHVTGIDFSPAMIEVARVKAAHSGAAVDFHVGDAAAPAVSDATFDLVLVRHVLWALPDAAQALTTWARLLGPGGRLLLIEGQWHTGSGIDLVTAANLVSAEFASVSSELLNDPTLWGGPITDERYLICATNPTTRGNG